MAQSIQITNKTTQAIALAIRPTTRFMCFEGQIRSGKTVTAIECFYYAVKTSPDALHCICAKDYDAIRDNILHSNGLGLLDLFPDVELKKEQIGGYYCQTMGYDGELKQILLVGYSNTKQWEKILGKTIGINYTDEANIADESFILESWARQVSAEKPLTIYTLNGDNPEHFIYQEYINYAKCLGVVPPSIKEDMDLFPNRDGWYYYHWRMTDNPVMTKEKIEKAMSIYPEGSYYHNIKVLGLRGVPEGSIFAQYLSEDMFSKPIEVVYRGVRQTLDRVEYLLQSGQYFKFCFGLDLGNNDTKRGTVLTFTGYTRGFQNVDIIDSYVCKSTEANALIDEICGQLAIWHRQIPNLGAVDSIRIDGFGAIQILIPSIRKRLIERGIRTVTDLAIKFGEQGGRRTRLDILLLLITQERINFSNRAGARECFIQLKKLRYDKDGLPLDVNQQEMDYYDSLGYTITPFSTFLTNVLRV